MHMRFAAALTLAGLTTISCGGVTSPSQNKVDTWSETLPVGGNKTFTTSVNNTGEFSVKITALSPTPTAFVGTQLALGGNCELLIQRNNFSTLNQPSLVGAIIQKGNYCLTIFDVGALTVQQTFTVTFSHP